MSIWPFGQPNLSNDNNEINTLLSEYFNQQNDKNLDSSFIDLSLIHI